MDKATARMYQAKRELATRRFHAMCETAQETAPVPSTEREATDALAALKDDVKALQLRLERLWQLESVDSQRGVRLEVGLTAQKMENSLNAHLLSGLGMRVRTLEAQVYRLPLRRFSRAWWRALLGLEA